MTEHERLFGSDLESASLEQCRNRVTWLSGDMSNKINLMEWLACNLLKEKNQKCGVEDVQLFLEWAEEEMRNGN